MPKRRHFSRPLSASHASCRSSEADAAMNREAVLAIFLATIALTTASVSLTRKCAKESQNACTVNELRITPCPKRPCALRRGREASLEFDYTPHFDASKLKTAVYWADDPAEVPFATIGIADACPHTTCPVVSGTNGTFTYSLYIGKKLPEGNFWFRWKVWNEDNVADICCFETLISIRR